MFYLQRPVDNISHHKQNHAVLSWRQREGLLNSPYKGPRLHSQQVCGENIALPIYLQSQAIFSVEYKISFFLEFSAFLARCGGLQACLQAQTWTQQACCDTVGNPTSPWGFVQWQIWCKCSQNTTFYIHYLQCTWVRCTVWCNLCRWHTLSCAAPQSLIHTNTEKDLTRKKIKSKAAIICKIKM